MTSRVRWIGSLLLLPVFSGAPAVEGKEAAKPTVTFLSAEEAAKALVDESIEPYFSLLQPIEMRAKTGGEALAAQELGAQRDECRERYRRGVREFDDDQKAAITSLAERLHAAWSTAYPRLADLPWSFLGVEDSIEGGLPHTRGRHIVLGTSVARAIAASVRAGAAAQREQIGLLAHEQCHVLQRLDPALFRPLYVSWGFARADGLTPAPEVLPRHVVNPDGPRVEWVFPVGRGASAIWHHPLVAFRDMESPNMPRDMEVLSVEMTKDGASYRPKRDAEGKALLHPLESVTPYGDAFGGIGENFHPNEIFAVFLSTMVVHDSFGGGGLPRPCDAAGKDFTTFRAWCRKNLIGRAAPVPTGK